jgi:uncharacterized protein YwgA
MSPYDFVHLTLYAMGGEVRGKTKLQKTMYFLGLLTKSAGDLGFRPHFYGPYSAEVAGAADRLRALGFATQSVASGGAIDRAGFEFARYDLRLNEEGTQVAQAKTKQYPEEWRKIQKAVEAFRKAEKADYVKLSIAAKTYFMLGQANVPTKAEDLAALAQEFGWSVTPDQIQQAFELLESLGLAKRG